jgi:ABC-type transport system involved in multi-copper enzyme maturation permease subunit
MVVLLDSIRLESAKALRQAQTWIVLLLSAIACLLSSWVLLAATDQGGLVSFDDRLHVAVTFGASLGLPTLPIWIIVLSSITAWTNEYQSNSVVLTLATIPRRRHLVIAKWTVWCLINCVASVGLTVIAAAVAYVYVGANVEFGLTDIFAQVARNVGYVACLTSLGLSLGCAVRSRAGAVATLYVGMWAVEPMVNFALVNVPALRPLSGYAPYLIFSALGNIQNSEFLGTYVRTRHLALDAALLEGLLVSLGVTVLSCLLLTYRRLPFDRE